MNHSSRKLKIKNKSSGIILILFSLVLFLLLGFGALIVDTVSAMNASLATQMAADIGVLSVTSNKLLSVSFAKKYGNITTNQDDAIKAIVLANLKNIPGVSSTPTFTVVQTVGDTVELGIDITKKHHLASAAFNFFGGKVADSILLHSNTQVKIPDLSLSIVFDRSGSMSAVDPVTLKTPLDWALLRVKDLIGRMRPTLDRVSLVTHADDANIVIPFNPGQGFSNTSVLNAVAAITGGNHTQLGAGLHLAVQSFDTIVTKTPDSVRAILFLGDGSFGGMNPLLLDPKSVVALDSNSYSSTGLYYYRIYWEASCGASEGVPEFVPPLGTPILVTNPIVPVADNAVSISHWSRGVTFPYIPPPFTPTCGTTTYDLNILTYDTAPLNQGFISYCRIHNPGFCPYSEYPKCHLKTALTPIDPATTCLSEYKILHPDPSLRPFIDIPGWGIADGPRDAQTIQTLLESDYARKKGIFVYSSYENTRNNADEAQRRLTLDPDALTLDTGYKHWEDLSRVPSTASFKSTPAWDYNGAALRNASIADASRSLATIMRRLQVKWKK